MDEIKVEGKRSDEGAAPVHGTVLETVSRSELTRPFSTRLVIMTMTLVFCSHTILQKSLKVDLSGP